MSVATLLRLDEWAGLEEDEPGELVDGQIVEEEVPDAVHETVVSWLNAFFRHWLKSQGSGWVFGSELKYGVTPGRGRKPDLSVFLPGRSAPPARGLVVTPPDVMVEVVSPTPADGRRDRIAKVDDYAAFGVRWYWIVDPVLRAIEILEWTPRGYLLRVNRSEGKVDLPGLPGVALDLDELWGEVDRLIASAPSESP